MRGKATYDLIACVCAPLSFISHKNYIWSQFHAFPWKRQIVFLGVITTVMQRSYLDIDRNRDWILPVKIPKLERYDSVDAVFTFSLPSVQKANSLEPGSNTFNTFHSFASQHYSRTVRSVRTRSPATVEIDSELQAAGRITMRIGRGTSYLTRCQCI